MKHVIFILMKVYLRQQIILLLELEGSKLLNKKPGCMWCRSKGVGNSPPVIKTLYLSCAESRDEICYLYFIETIKR